MSPTLSECQTISQFHLSLVAYCKQALSHRIQVNLYGQKEVNTAHVVLTLLLKTGQAKRNQRGTAHFGGKIKQALINGFEHGPWFEAVYCLYSNY